MEGKGKEGERGEIDRVLGIMWGLRFLVYLFYPDFVSNGIIKTLRC